MHLKYWLTNDKKKWDKGDYKKLLLANGGEALNQRLHELLVNDPRYAESLRQISSLLDKLEWSIKAHIDVALESWLKKQGERLGFELTVDDDGLSKLQNSLKMTLELTQFSPGI